MKEILLTSYRKKQFDKNDWYMTGLLHELNPAYIEEMIFYYNRCYDLLIIDIDNGVVSKVDYSIYLPIIRNVYTRLADRFKNIRPLIHLDIVDLKVEANEIIPNLIDSLDKLNLRVDTTAEATHMFCTHMVVKLSEVHKDADVYLLVNNWFKISFLISFLSGTATRITCTSLTWEQVDQSLVKQVRDNKIETIVK